MRKSISVCLALIGRRGYRGHFRLPQAAITALPGCHACQMRIVLTASSIQRWHACAAMQQEQHAGFYWDEHEKDSIGWSLCSSRDLLCQDQSDCHTQCFACSVICTSFGRMLHWAGSFRGGFKNRVTRRELRHGVHSSQRLAFLTTFCDSQCVNVCPALVS